MLGVEISGNGVEISGVINRLLCNWIDSTSRLVFNHCEFSAKGYHDGKLLTEKGFKS